MVYQRSECKECGSLLWSEYAKQIKLCPDCETPDTDYVDLETQSENLLKA